MFTFFGLFFPKKKNKNENKTGTKHFHTFLKFSQLFNSSSTFKYIVGLSLKIEIWLCIVCTVSWKRCTSRPVLWVSLAGRAGKEACLREKTEMAMRLEDERAGKCFLFFLTGSVFLRPSSKIATTPPFTGVSSNTPWLPEVFGVDSFILFFFKCI